MRADTRAAPPTGGGMAAAGAPATRATLRCLDAGMEAGSSASAPSLLFPVFLLLAALVATLTTRRTAHPTNETAVLASLAGRFASPGTAAGTASRDEAELLAALERLRPRLARDATESSETNPTSLDGDWRVTYPAELFFDEATDQPRPGRRVLLYRLAQAAEALAPSLAASRRSREVSLGPLSAPARLAEICRRLIDLGAPAAAIRLRSRREGLDAVTLALTGARRGA